MDTAFTLPGGVLLAVPRGVLLAGCGGIILAGIRLSSIGQATEVFKALAVFHAETAGKALTAADAVSKAVPAGKVETAAAEEISLSSIGQSRESNLGRVLETYKRLLVGSCLLDQFRLLLASACPQQT